MRYLVTGANGFLGKTLVKKMLSLGFGVVTLSRKPLGFSDKNLTSFECDLNDIGRVLKDVSIDIIFHTAASVNLVEDENAYRQIAQDNILSAIRLSEFAKEKKVKKLVFSSTCSVYDRNLIADQWITEDYKLRPINSYAVSKLSAEWILSNELATYIESIVILRYSSIYGSGQRQNTLLPILINNAIQNKDLNLYGSGKRRQDYVFVDDIVQANLQSIESDLPPHQILNIGSGMPVSDFELANFIREEWTSKSVINVLNTSTDQETFLNYDIGKAQMLIGYTPTSLQQGLHELHKMNM